MTKPDEIEDNGAARPFLGQVLFYLGVCIAVGGAGAGVVVFAERGIDLRGAAVIGTTVAVGLAALIWSLRIGNFDPPSLSSKTGRSQLVLLLCVILGAATSFYFVTNGVTDRFIEGDFSLTRFEAGLLLFVTVGLGLPLGILRERDIDDFERKSTRDAAYWAFNLYIYGYLAWAIAASGSLLPPINHFALFLVVMFTFLGMWAAKRAG
ncbi:hypothetical protein NAP1_05110 [Erythrobacter sp. NAP1]|uniref:hypothetical protein n=1 Tax=Erythrobacter sp. NAP1 TaxID=237727 RepID=UPI0000686AF2|nr:hypothetical protein [Erythrobacter sp. NAP1]EAQ30128.1 hypothetical protein NAP1_05110 [Erythrobacter sp. NAP1]